MSVSVPAAKPELTPLEATQKLLDISVTERGQFRSCRRRWWLETIQNWEPKGDPALALEFGTGMHEALELIHGPKSSSTLDHALEALETWFEETVEKHDLHDEAYTELHELHKLGVGMLRNYKNFNATAKVQLGTVLAVEGHWLKGQKAKVQPEQPKGYPDDAAPVLHESGRLLIPIVDPQTKDLVPEEPCLSARIDLLTERTTPKKGLWIVDHKTAAQSPSDRGIDFDDQVTGYCYAVWRWTGEVPRGVVYNVLIKQEPKPPRILQKERHGSVLSTAKDQLCTADDYRKALKEHKLVMAGGTIVTEQHADCLEALLARGMDPFFRRFEVTRNQHELESFERRLYEEWDDMGEAYELESKRYPNPSTFHCPNCPVKTICQSMEEGSDFEYVIESQYVQGEDRKAAR